MAVMDLAVARGLAVFMARVVVQIPAFRGIQVVIVTSSNSSVYLLHCGLNLRADGLVSSSLSLVY